MSDEEYKTAETLVEDEEQLQIARSNREARRIAQKEHVKFMALSREKEWAEMANRFSSSRFDDPIVMAPRGNDVPIQTSVKKQLDDATDLGTLYLEGIVSKTNGMPYESLDRIRRATIRDVLRLYVHLSELQDLRQTIEPKALGANDDIGWCLL